MKYNYFIIKKYKSIKQDIKIDLKNKIIPIIGVNECGKTTILQAILAFSHFNDKAIQGKHLDTVENLHDPYDKGIAHIEANISIDEEEFKSIIQKWQKTTEEVIFDNKQISSNLTIVRQLNGDKKYSITQTDEFLKSIKSISSSIRESDIEALAKTIIEHLPRIIYFDDFNDSMPDVIEVPQNNENKQLEGWLAIIEVLLKKTHEDLSIKTLHERDKNNLNSVQRDVNKTLNKTISSKWTDFKDLGGQEGKAFNLEFIYKISDNSSKNTIQIQVVEKIKKSNEEQEIVFDIKDRSKGFYWFFNFVMKLEFNPQGGTDGHENNTIFLLDEPGSYLHYSMQRKLCEKLHNLSKNNTVIYCTHTHNLIHPNYIKLSLIKVAHKEKDGNVKLLTLSDYSTLENNIDVNTNKQALALEPIYNVLGISNTMFNNLHNQIVLVEGIDDFYCCDMFKGDSKISFIPFTGALAINDLIPLFVAGERKFVVLRDGDKEGEKAQKKLPPVWGEEIGKINFTLKNINEKFTKIESLFHKQEIDKFKDKFELTNTSPKKLISKVIRSVYFHSDKEKFVDEMKETQKNFNTVFKHLEKNLKK